MVHPVQAHGQGDVTQFKLCPFFQPGHAKLPSCQVQPGPVQSQLHGPLTLQPQEPEHQGAGAQRFVPGNPGRPFFKPGAQFIEVRFQRLSVSVLGVQVVQELVHDAAAIQRAQAFPGPRIFPRVQAVLRERSKRGVQLAIHQVGSATELLALRLPGRRVVVELHKRCARTQVFDKEIRVFAAEQLRTLSQGNRSDQWTAGRGDAFFSNFGPTENHLVGTGEQRRGLRPCPLQCDLRAGMRHLQAPLQSQGKQGHWAHRPGPQAGACAGNPQAVETQARGFIDGKQFHGIVRTLGLELLLVRHGVQPGERRRKRHGAACNGIAAAELPQQAGPCLHRLLLAADQSPPARPTQCAQKRCEYRGPGPVGVRLALSAGLSRGLPAILK